MSINIDKIQAVVIGASTGGPNALVHLVSKLPKSLDVPIFIVQHMPKGFTKSFAIRLDKESKVTVVEATNDMKIEKGVVYLAPGDFHMLIEKDRIKLSSQDRLFGVRPAVDYLFKTAAKNYKGNVLGIILTGMGKDGADGMSTIKDFGGYNIAQNKESCVVFGMPGNAIARGVVDIVMDLEEISQLLDKFGR